MELTFRDVGTSLVYSTVCYLSHDNVNNNNNNNNTECNIGMYYVEWYYVLTHSLPAI